MEHLKKEAFTLAGLQLQGKTSNANNQSMSDCGSLWQKFENENIAALIPQKLSDEIYAVYFDYEGDETGAFSYFIGCKVDKSADIPTSLNTLDVPAQHYIKVTAQGKMTGCITDAWKSIWNSDIPRKFSFDFEVYDERSQDWNDAEVDIFISINK